MSRPSARKREKKVARAAATRAKVTARRARRDAARAAATAPDPRRNLHVDRGRPVVVNDITPYARPKCGACKGKGIFGTKADAEGNTQSAEPCRCAHLRFMKAHPEIIVTETGEAFWPEETTTAKTWNQLTDAEVEKVKETGEPPSGVTITEELGQ